MTKRRLILLSGAAACALWSPKLWGQDVQVISDKGTVTLSIMAQTAHVAGQAKTPVLSVICQQKGKKFTHEIAFEPGGMLTEGEYSSFGKSTSLTLETTIGGNKQKTMWVSNNDNNPLSFDYVGKTEPERIHFLQSLLNAPAVSIEFTPFLTGIPASSTFDLTGLRTEFDKHPECTIL